jgi:hypothetical protein
VEEATLFDLKPLVDLADQLGVIRAVKQKLLRQPDSAADSLVVVLGELSKIYGACDAELLRYLNLSFDPAGRIADERAVLLTLEGGQLRTRTGEARGHCHKIWNIYQRDLHRWFNDVLAPSEASSMEELFKRLTYADSQMEVAISELTRWLTRQAEETLNLVDMGKLDQANQRIRSARKEVLPTRQFFNRVRNEMLEMQAEFIQLSKTV